MADIGDHGSGALSHTVLQCLLQRMDLADDEARSGQPFSQPAKGIQATFNQKQLHAAKPKRLPPRSPLSS